ncbi:aldehyde dehydrogenase family protein [Rhizobium leguminosarum]|uniref:aldehyde dehydrogenase family protein n=1 Tax=Rhizobium leguminosarum TaxID=384 RepID=UPI00143F17E7|nr:aldehyde dehydrogenase family protein [Rhizobium leguminosarum]MCA2412164.1 aldehyde dehydrogenase family protein [Rhizobium leguminosarum]NKM66163.1 aldehyde dehydrogenase family protein [Rhizobium leguminosarum bv. viciae]NKM95965.1 aldehyde dehydrogenase family protein [Rhizobium leguminosarum bv. viciae]
MSHRQYGLWINGAVERPAENRTYDRYSPATGELVASICLATPENVGKAVASAKAAFKSGVWSKMPAIERGKIIQRFADLVMAELDHLSVIEADEAGKTMAAARGEIQWSVELARFAATLAWNIPGRVVNHEGAEKLGLITHEALPVVGMILPWNFPTVTLFQKLPYALVAGCSVVIKPSTFTPGTTLEYARLAKDAGIPDGVISVLPGNGDEVGRTLCLHPDIDMISFTGSTNIGKEIAGLCGQTLKKVALELGGKGANIVFADADLDAAVDGALAAFTINQGEECCAGARLLVETSIAGDFVDRLAIKARALKLGTSKDADADLGPMIHEQHHAKVLSYIETSKGEGAKLVTGGGRPGDPRLDAGYFVEPTIFTGITPEMTIFNEEVFGPVLGVTTFENEAEAIALANATPYGLANGVWTKDLDRAMHVSAALESGFVYVNCYLETVPQLPFGGAKASGLGRENGTEGLLEFMQTKSTFMRLRATR